MFKASWRTTAAGIAAILTLVGNAIKAYIDNDPTTTVDLVTLMAGLSVAVGLLNARDDKVTSEASGAKTKDQDWKPKKVPLSLLLMLSLLLILLSVGCSSTQWGTYRGKSLGRALNIGEAGEETITYSPDGKVLSTERKWLKGTQSDTLSGFKAGLDFGAQFLEMGKKVGAGSIAPGAGNLIDQ